MDRRPSRKTHAVSPRQMPDRLLLLAAFALGAGGGVALKLLGVDPLLSAGFAALVLIAYAAATYYTTPLRLEPEAIGDNCYYLGFLFTLTSLSVTLYFVVRSGAESRAELIPEVISGFGVALSSTIMGVFLRVLMMQFRVDLVTREQHTRLELDMAARELREEMARSLRQVKSFSLESLQLAGERDEAMRRQSDAVLAGVQAQMQHTAALVGETVQAAVRDQTALAMAAIREQGAVGMLELRAAIQDAALAMLDSARTAFTALDAEKGAVTGFRLTVADEIGRLSAALAGTTDQMAEQSDRLARSLDRAVAQYEDAARRLAFATAALDATLTAPPARQTAAERERKLRAELDEPNGRGD
ncbi:hypothetical protein [Paracoccus aminovorans]|uniref:hypothetical protein n=1 Tax=Paracoccus aminovorans TaxID=34004 RepID=UPI002B260DA8|nr:hypothetical protein [Paracoccus aminovorans]